MANNTDHRINYAVYLAMKKAGFYDDKYIDQEKDITHKKFRNVPNKRFKRGKTIIMKDDD